MSARDRCQPALVSGLLILVTFFAMEAEAALPHPRSLEPNNVGRVYALDLSLESPAPLRQREVPVRPVVLAQGATYTGNTGLSFQRLDFDADSRSDILWRHDGGTVGMWEMNGFAIKLHVAAGLVTNDWQIVGTGDFDFDGRTDILWRHIGGNVAIWEMTGSTVKASLPISNVSNDWHIVGTGDFDGDGRTDILWRNDSGAVAVWLMNGATVKSSLGVGTVTNDWHIVGTGDFDGDRRTDILWRNDSGAVGIWEMNGATIKALQGLGTVDNDWRIVGTGDFDGDLKTDILWRYIDGTVGVWEMNGFVIKASSAVGSISNDWRIVSTGDYDADGRNDILWRHIGGDVGIWEMNGTTVKAFSGVSSIANDWSIVDRGPAAFLTFSLQTKTPFTVGIISVMDHSGTPLDPNNGGSWYTSDGKVIAYTGETGDKQFGANCPPSGYKNSSGTAFVVNGNYVGSSCGGAGGDPRLYLNYDGHSGYDYQAALQTTIYAPADGVLKKAAIDNVNHNHSCAHNGWDEWHSFYIDHENGYVSWYLHADRLASNIESQIGSNYSKTVRVHKGDAIALSGNFSACFSLAPHLHFETRFGPVELPSPQVDKVVDPYSAALWAFQ